MAEWKIPSVEEEAELRGLGQDPDHIVVNRVGIDSRVYLNVRTREEIIVGGPCGAAEKVLRPRM